MLPLWAALGVVLAVMGACTRSSQESSSANIDATTQKESTERAAEARRRLAEQRRHWQTSFISNYRFTFIRSVAQGPSSSNPVIVTVRNGEIASAKYKSAPEIVKVDPEKQKQLPTVDSLFVLIEESVHKGVDSLRVRYDAEAGFPYSIFIDPNAQETSDEVGIEVRDFVPLTSKQQS